MHLNVTLNKQSVRKRTPGLFKEDRHIKHTRAVGINLLSGSSCGLLRISRAGKAGTHSAASRNVPLFFPPKSKPFGGMFPSKGRRAAPRNYDALFLIGKFPDGG